MVGKRRPKRDRGTPTDIHAIHTVRSQATQSVTYAECTTLHKFPMYTRLVFYVRLMVSNAYSLAPFFLDCAISWRIARSVMISSLPPPTRLTLKSRLICSTREPTPPR